MSEQEVPEAARANTAAMNTQAMGDYASTFTEDALWEDDAFGAAVVGRADVAETMASFYTAFPDLHFEVKREFASGDQTAVCWRVTGTHRGQLRADPADGATGGLPRVRRHADTGRQDRLRQGIPGHRRHPAAARGAA